MLAASAVAMYRPPENAAASAKLSPARIMSMTVSPPDWVLREIFIQPSITMKKAVAGSSCRMMVSCGRSNAAVAGAMMC